MYLRLQYVTLCNSNVTAWCHIASVNDYLLINLRSSSEYCPYRTFFVCLRTVGNAYPVSSGCCMFHYIYISIMAIVNSLAIGKSVKSAGNLTYKTVRGRTIASQRITSNKSNTIAQAAQRSHFSACSQAIALLAPYIDVCYEKSKYGSARNAFFKENPNFNLAGLVGEIREGIVTLADGFLLSLQGTDDNISRINFVSKGTLPCFINAATSVRASFTYAEQTYSNILAYSSPSDGITVNLSSPAAPYSVSIAVFGFGKNGLATAIGKYDDGMPSPLFEGDTTLSASFNRSRITVDPTSKLVTSIQIAAELDPVATSAFGCVVAVPVVGGRTITSSAVFLPPSE